MANDIANNMADTIHQLEEDRIMLSTQLADLQLAYNDQMLELKEAKKLLKSARSIIEDIICNEDYLCNECEYRAKCDGGFSFYWRYADEALKLIGGSENG